MWEKFHSWQSYTHTHTPIYMVVLRYEIPNFEMQLKSSPPDGESRKKNMSKNTIKLFYLQLWLVCDIWMFRHAYDSPKTEMEICVKHDLFIYKIIENSPIFYSSEFSVRLRSTCSSWLATVVLSGFCKRLSAFSVDDVLCAVVPHIYSFFGQCCYSFCCCCHTIFIKPFPNAVTSHFDIAYVLAKYEYSNFIANEEQERR